MTTRFASLSLAVAALFSAVGCASRDKGSFATPDEAVQRLVESSGDEAAADELLGPGGFSLLSSGDEIADRADVESVRAMIREGVRFEDVGEDCKLALLGKDGWELPLPLVREESGRWRFDVEAGREEVLNRRVGRNELSTIETLRAIVDGQREYASEARDGSTRAYARKVVSSPGKKDGLYWPVAPGEAESPLGPLVAEAALDGYGAAKPGSIPYHGYFYRMLTEQGANAPGGARSYLDAADRLTGGFAAVAWPATYGNSGVMTFIVNQQGIVFQKDLGPETSAQAAAIRAYDPDASWTPASD